MTTTLYTTTHQYLRRIVSILLQAGADATVKGTLGKNARELAEQMKKTEIVRILDGIDYLRLLIFF